MHPPLAHGQSAMPSLHDQTTIRRTQSGTDHISHMEKVTLTGSAATLLLTLYGRALESRSPEPLLWDPTAEQAVDAIDYDFSGLGINRTAVVSIAARARRLDEWTTRFLHDHPQATVLHLGCGLDSRIERVKPPPSVSWFDVDYPEVIELRRRLFPARDHHTLVASSVTEPGWLDNVPADRPVLVIAEGLTMYLYHDDFRALVLSILRRFREGELAFDVLNRFAVRVVNRSRMMKVTGAAAVWGLEDVREIAAWNSRLTLVETVPSYSVCGVDKLPVRMRIATRIPVFRDSSRLLRLTFDIRCSG
ncbi:MAG: class I SAM-dependent methyltransferase [Pseudonocardiales bacterium]|nr:class I SAM-dependent methyltransferase [Pseudonocardiales bacterium]